MEAISSERTSPGRTSSDGSLPVRSFHLLVVVAAALLLATVLVKLLTPPTEISWAALWLTVVANLVGMLCGAV
nr:hypothetical protein [Micromonospora sp. DSM 115978]